MSTYWQANKTGQEWKNLCDNRLLSAYHGAWEIVLAEGQSFETRQGAFNTHRNVIIEADRRGLLLSTPCPYINYDKEPA